ncbi:hypothetical protein J2S30_003357 [Herbaspirillum rubrisubalbicans]|nr:hypothetical protein [Herbaspirillum rubrisubalbicans]
MPSRSGVGIPTGQLLYGWQAAIAQLHWQGCHRDQGAVRQCRIASQQASQLARIIDEIGLVYLGFGAHGPPRRFVAQQQVALQPGIVLAQLLQAVGGGHGVVQVARRQAADRTQGVDRQRQFQVQRLRVMLAGQRA